MSLVDWLVLSFTLIFIITYGIWKNYSHKNIKDYIKGGNKASWLTVGLSVMATQASAITFLSTPGQGFNDGMGFIQFYFGLPFAMIIICIFFIPVYHKLNLFTAYEFLEKRFDLKTRTLTSILFLIQRGLAAGITIYAPAIILSVVLGWNLKSLVVIIGLLVILYTMLGGTKAVNVTQKYQMFIIFSGMITAFIFIIQSLPDNIKFSNALQLAGINEKLNMLDFSFDLENRYTFWSGITGGLFWHYLILELTKVRFNGTFLQNLLKRVKGVNDEWIFKNSHAIFYSSYWCFGIHFFSIRKSPYSF